MWIYLKPMVVGRERAYVVGEVYVVGGYANVEGKAEDRSIPK